jgi:hypothetical protein
VGRGYRCDDDPRRRLVTLSCSESRSLVYRDEAAIVKAGEASFGCSGDDLVTMRWEGGDGSLHELDLDLRELADLQAGRAVSGYGSERSATLRQRIATALAKGDQIRARMDDLSRHRSGRLKSLGLQ